MIITPLFPYFCAGFIKVFGDEIIVLRFLEVLSITSILFTIYKIMLRIKINKGVAIISIFTIIYVYKEMFCFDYNWAVLLIQLVLLYVELGKKEEVNIKREILLGLIARDYYTFETDYRNNICYNICFL